MPPLVRRPFPIYQLQPSKTVKNPRQTDLETIMLSEILWTLSACFFLPFAGAEVITTTLNSIQERSVAVLDQESFIRTVMLDAATDIARYSSIMYSENIEIPQSLLQFIVEINTYEISAFPTSVFISSFPFEDFQTFITHFPWMSDYLSSCSMTEFKVPAEYSVITTTIHGDEASAVTNSASPSSSSTVVSLTSSISSTALSSSSTSSSPSSLPSSSGVSSAARSTTQSKTSNISSLSTTLHSSTTIHSSAFNSSSSSSTPSSISSSSPNAASAATPGTLLFLIFLVIPLLS